MANNFGDIEIHQTLHGYNNGHTLLASSTEIQSDAKRAMLPISDMSGPTMQPGFEEYITAYPIKEINTYALAKTWYASEMKRPGCVWTHTLLINFADLPKIDGLNTLLSLFKKPHNALDISYFQQPLKWISNPRDNIQWEPLESNIESELTKQVIDKLYDGKDLSILVKSDNTYQYEKLFFCLWFQQWPRLQRNFGFCTGALLPRIINGKPLDIQVVPSKIESYTVEDKNYIFINSSDNFSISNLDRVDTVFNDLLIPSEFRVFSKYFGADVDGNRESFKSLINIFLYLKEKKHLLGSYVKKISQQFPDVKVANNLKMALLAKDKITLNEHIPNFSERDILFELSVTPYYSSLDYGKLRYKDRFFDFFFAGDEEAVLLLEDIFNEEPNILAQEMIRLLSHDPNFGTSSATLWSNKNLLSIFLNLNPTLAYNKMFWQTNPDLQAEIINTLRLNSGNATLDWRTIIWHLIEAKSVIDLGIFDKTISDIPIQLYILDWLQQNEDSNIDKNWINLLRDEPSAVLSWLNNNQEISTRIISIAIEILDPNSKLVIANGLNIWQHFLSQSYYNNTSETSLNIKVFALALALNLSNSKSKKVIGQTLESVYYAIYEQKLSYENWRRIEIHTRPLTFWKDWDRCKKLIIAIVELTIKNKWDLNEITSSILNHELVARVWNQYKKYL